MDDIIDEVLRAEQACAAEIESAHRRCRERIAARSQALERERAAVKAQLQGAHNLKLQEELDACRQAGAAGLAQVRARQESLLQEADLCARIQNRIIDIILEA